MTDIALLIAMLIGNGIAVALSYYRGRIDGARLKSQERQHEGIETYRVLPANKKCLHPTKMLKREMYFGSFAHLMHPRKEVSFVCSQCGDRFESVMEHAP